MFCSQPLTLLQDALFCIDFVCVYVCVCVVGVGVRISYKLCSLFGQFCLHDQFVHVSACVTSCVCGSTYSG